MPSLIQLEWLNRRSLIKPFNGIMWLLESLRGARLDEEQWEHMKWNWFSATMAAPLRRGVRETQWGSGSSGESILHSIWDLALGWTADESKRKDQTNFLLRVQKRRFWKTIQSQSIDLSRRKERAEGVTCIWSQLLLHHVQAIVWPGNQW